MRVLLSCGDCVSVDAVTEDYDTVSSSLVGVHLVPAVVILVRNVPYEKLLLLTITTPGKATTSLPSRGSSCHAIRPHSLVWFE